MKLSEEMIDKAFKVLEENQSISLVESGSIREIFKSYISSFGASVINSGLLAALVFNHQEQNNNVARDRRKLMRVLREMIQDYYPGYQNEETLLKLAIAVKRDNMDLFHLQKMILTAANALKLVIRTYELKKTENHES